MLNTPIQPVQQGYPQVQNVTPQNQSAEKIAEQQKTALSEQRLAISFDIAAEYAAITRMDNLVASLANEIRAEEDADRKKLLESRINTLKTIILQREAKINQMEMLKTQLDKQIA